jgi:dTDP-glucose 4,6-dehydratase
MRRRMNNFLITGCAGFIGSHTADLFVKMGHSVIGVDCLTYAGNLRNVHRNVKHFTTDICDTARVLDICHEFNIDHIVNFAAESHVDNSILGHDSFIHSNVQGVKSLLEVCKSKDIPFIHISTDEVYGPIRTGSFGENSKLNPQNYYSATKAAAEHLVSAYHNTFDIEYLMVRMGNNYGPRQHKEKFIPTILNSLRNSHKIPLYGDGKNIRDWIYVKDSAKAIYNLVQNSPRNQIYNLSFGDERENVEVIRIILEQLDLSFDDNVSFVEDRLGHDFRYSITNDKMMKFIGFTPTDFVAGIRETIDCVM